jgi:hypothetical protein
LPTRHPWHNGVEDIIIFKGQEPPQGDFNIFNWLLMVLRGTLALQSLTETFLISFPPPFSNSENEQKTLLCKWLPNEEFLSEGGDSQTAVNHALQMYLWLKLQACTVSAKIPVANITP